MARELPEELEAALVNCHRRTTIQITLGDNSVLNLSTGDCEVGELSFLGKLAPVDSLNMELTSAFEGINLKICNVSKVLGQTLINTPDILSGTTAILGCYFEDTEGNKWHDEKITGEIEVGEIDGDWINIFFIAKTDAVIYGGIIITDAFPDEEIPTEELPTETSNPVYNDVDTAYSYRNRDLINDWNNEKYYLPQMMEY